MKANLYDYNELINKITDSTDHEECLDILEFIESEKESFGNGYKGIEILACEKVRSLLIAMCEDELDGYNKNHLEDPV